MAPDPLVADSIPLVAAIQRVLRSTDGSMVDDFVRVARGFSHP